jgi:hypothetical protein
MRTQSGSTVARYTGDEVRVSCPHRAQGDVWVAVSAEEGRPDGIETPGGGVLVAKGCDIRTTMTTQRDI